VVAFYFVSRDHWRVRWNYQFPRLISIYEHFFYFFVVVKGFVFPLVLTCYFSFLCAMDYFVCSTHTQFKKLKQVTIIIIIIYCHNFPKICFFPFWNIVLFSKQEDQGRHKDFPRPCVFHKPTLFQSIHVMDS
jgi:hypothetical protein